jgi:hypothetical protein
LIAGSGCECEQLCINYTYVLHCSCYWIEFSFYLITATKATVKLTEAMAACGW